MNTIALLTDFGADDWFTAAVKAVIVSKNSKARLIDISHSAASHNINKAAFILSSCFSYFPKKTVFIAVVDPGVGSSRRPIAIKTKNYFFVGPDNGVLSLAAEEDGIARIVELKNKKYFLKEISSTFHGRDIFAPVAAYLSKGLNINKLGNPLKGIKKISFAPAKLTRNKIYGEVLYADKFGNLITNIPCSLFESFKKQNNHFSCILNKKTINKEYSFYEQARDNEPFFIRGRAKFMEIALKNKRAKDFFNLKTLNHKITVKN